MKKCFVLFIVALLAVPCLAELKLATPFCDHAVLQREAAVPVWGKATPGSEVTVSFAGQSVSGKADENGDWSVQLEPMEASFESRTMTVSEKGGESKTIEDVLVGEVWFASGQSNMECPVWDQDPRFRDGTGKLVMAMTRNPYLRFIKVNRGHDAYPRSFIPATWYHFTPEEFEAHKEANKNERSLSAVGFYYALQLFSSLRVPIGVIDASWGGTNIDAWTPRSGYENHPELRETAEYPVTNKWEPSMARGVISWYMQQPTVLWNGMVAPFVPFASRGFIWYQGCNNAGEAEIYCDKMHALYDGWAKEFKNPDFKLYFVQLAPYWQSFYELELAQAKFAREEKNAAFVPTCDVGNMHDIHPNKKEMVARRLALHALKDVYGFPGIVSEAPYLTDYEIKDGAFVLTFQETNNWYYYTDDNSKPKGFEVAGDDGRYFPAEIKNEEDRHHGRLKGEKLIVASAEVPKPRSIRYLATAPFFGALYSGVSGLPVPPFEVDNGVVLKDEAKLGDALKIPELAGFKVVLQSDLPDKGKFTEENYSVNKLRSLTSAPKKAAYVMELVNKKDQVMWGVAIMDTPVIDLTLLGVPIYTNVVVQQKVGNLTVRSNVPGVKEVTDSEGGVIEFWEGNYTSTTKLPDIGGSNDDYDFNDKPLPEDGHYGSMQIHDAANQSTVMAYNDFNTPGVTCDIGIGNNSGKNPDYTFQANAAKFKVRRLTILVK